VATALSGLQRLYLGCNNINDTLGADWGGDAGWGELEELCIQDNLFYGLLPAEWGEEGRWASMREMNLSDNHLQGRIPGADLDSDPLEVLVATRATGSVVKGQIRKVVFEKMLYTGELR
jgi:hypothetical protein